MKKAKANDPEKLEVSPFGVKANRKKMGRICLKVRKGEGEGEGQPAKVS